ncbi:MAG: glycosyltransferase family 2 protein [Cytophagaceae bacterium]
MKLSIVIPCYNEAANIPLILERLNEVIKRDDVEILLVNNGSTDNSAEILDNLIPRYSFARKVMVPVNQGYGFGILSGLKESKGEFIGWTHADMQTDPYDCIKALDIIEKVPQERREDLYIKGRRKGRSLFDEFFTSGMSLFETVYLGTKLWDINAQPNVFHNTFYRIWENPPYDFSLDLFVYYIARRKNLNILRFDVIFPPRIYGESKWNTGFRSKIKFIKRTIAFSKGLKKNLKST